MSGRPRILILGSTGQVGMELHQAFAEEGEIIACNRDMADLSVPDQIRNLVRRIAPDVILNAAAYTAVDQAEFEPELAIAINAHLPGILAQEALRTRALLVHYSTDYVFDGSKTGPWIETDLPNPLNVYGASKLAGENAIREVNDRHLIFRTSWVYGPHGKNFLMTMLRLARQRTELNIVDDQHGAPTTSIELADATHTIVRGIWDERFGSDGDWAGVYHMTCSGDVSWYGFAQAILTRARALLDGNAPTIHPIHSSDYPTAARRPHNSVLSNEKLRMRFGIQLGPWDAALDVVLRTLGAPSRAD